ncbi:putative transcription factor interactor and regulator CCHC(Zn) family [Helianthus debilis subsp. tardiflorus]
MGATNSKVEEDKALQLCRERKKYVGKALDGRCSLAATHFTYIESLTIIGSALRRFVEPDATMQPSLYTSISGTPEQLAFSFSSTMSQHVNPAGNRSPTPSPPTSSRFHANHMKIRGSFSRKVEEKPSVPVIVSVTSSSTPQTTTPRSIDEPEIPFEPSPVVPEKAPETPFDPSPVVRKKEPKTPFDPSSAVPESQPWDYFGLTHPIDNEFSAQETHELNHGHETYNDMQIPREGEEEKSPTEGSVTYQESEDEFDESDTDGLVRSFENVNRVVDNVGGIGLRSMSSAESMTPETEILNGEKGNSPYLSPLKRKTSGVRNIAIPQEEKTEVVKEAPENRPVPKDLISSMRDIEQLFIKASECGREVPRMLEANKLHFRPIFQGKERGSFTSKFLKACMSCGDDPSQVQEEEPAQNDTKYLTWNRSNSSRASSFRHDPASGTTRETPEDVSTSLFDNFCMNAGSHASTLDRLHAWEKKLYDEVKANEMLRKVYDQKRKLLRELESTGESSRRIDKTRSIVKDLHWRIGVAIHRINSISRKIEDLRDKELHPQLEELIEGYIKDLQDQVRELTLAVQRRRGNDRTPPRYRPDYDYDTDEFSQAGDYNPYGRRSPNNRNHTDIKVDIPEYDGKLDPDEFVEWLRTVERVFDYKHTVEEKKVKFVALKLRKYASTWWANVCSQREKMGKSKVRSWQKMKKLLKAKFMPVYYLQESFTKLHFIKQGTRSVEEFSQEFEHLLMKCDLGEDDPQTLVRYLGGLESRIANIVELQSYSTLAELRLMAHKVESQQKARGKMEAAKQVNKPSLAPNALSMPTSEPSPMKTIDVPDGSSTISKHSRRCFRCQGLGHIASECPNKRVITLAEFEALSEPKFDEEPNHQRDKEEVVIGPDDGECLVMRRALNGTAVHCENLQREALFRTRCTIRDKVCSIVIDGGSCTNVASQTMISKLNLLTEPHPSPYDIHWLNQGKG